MRNKGILTLLIGAALLLLVSACSTPGTGTPQPTVQQVLQNSQKAMSQLKSAHVSLLLNGSGASYNSPGTPGTTPTTGGTVTFKLSGSGDEALPGQEKMNFTVTQSVTNTTTSFAEILSGGKLYAQFGGKWYQVNSSNGSNPFAGVGAPNMSQLLGLLNHMQIIDHGMETLNGVSVRHITFMLDKVALQQLLSSNPQLVGAIGQGNINAIINNSQAFASSLDLWIDETQYYMHRAEFKLNMNVNAASLAATVTPTSGSPIQPYIPSTVLTNLDSIMDLSNFNQPVLITPPPNATPITLPNTTSIP
jgi:hypothetical protein